MKSLIKQVACVSTLALTSLTQGQQMCGQDIVFDMSPWNPDAVIGEAISITSLQGEIVHARVDAVFVSNEKLPWVMSAAFALPTGIIGVDSDTGGWSGTGTFKMSVESDNLNGFLVPPDDTPWTTWFLVYSGGAFSELPDGTDVVSPMNGYFETLKLTLTLAECPQGDLTKNYDVDVDDLLTLINEWGDCPTEKGAECEADLDGSSVVDVDDLLMLINNWGDHWCPFCS